MSHGRGHGMNDVRRAGRPRLYVDELTESLTVGLPTSAYDRIVRVALARDVPVAVVAREVLLRAFPTEKSTRMAIVADAGLTQTHG